MAVLRMLMELVRILLTITRPFSYTFLNAVYRIIYGAKRQLPSISDRILLINATRLAKKIRQGELKSEDIVKAYIKRIEEVQPFIKACIDYRFEEAVKEAKEVDRLIAKGNKSEEQIEKETPLLGVPFSCKEAVGLKGLIQSCGIYSARNRKCPEDGDCPSLYREAGAIPLEVTNVPEMSLWWDCVNVPFGTTYNPYDNRRGPGGSSGGEAALIASAAAIIGIGNDMAGSIRMPSAFNGIYAIKPSPGMISNRGYWPNDEEEGLNEVIESFIGTGPMCRYAEDLPLLAEILSERRINFDKKVNFTKLKIYYVEEFPGYLLKCTPDIKAAVRKAAKYFEETFSNSPVNITVPELRYAMEIWESKVLEAGEPPLKQQLEEVEPGTKINLSVEFFKAVCGFSEHTPQAIYYATIERCAKDSQYYRFLAMFETLKERLDEMLKGGALLLLPTHPEPAPHHYLTIPKYANQGYTAIFNVLGYPSTQIPAGQSSNGLPIGIQAVSSKNDDYVTITAAVQLEKVFGGWKSPSEVLDFPGRKSK